MRLFEVLPDVRWRRGEIDATHKWGLPGLTCATCGATWSAVGLAYPSVDLSALPSEKRYRDRWPVTLGELDELRHPIIPLMPDGSIPPPGTHFGPLVGKTKGTFGDFAWLNPWTLLIRSEALERLCYADMHMPIGVRPALTYSEKDPPDLLELQIEPKAKTALGSLPPNAVPQCRSCGRQALTLPEYIVIEQSSIPQNLDLFRGQDFTTLIFATERFAEAVQNLKLTGMVFREVDVLR